MSGVVSLPLIAAEHWRAAAHGELRLPACRACAHMWFPPSRHCPRCLSAEIEWRVVSGRGRVEGVCEMHRDYFRSPALPAPYTVILVRLDAGPLLYSNPLDLRMRPDIGDLVEARFVPLDGETGLVRFAPVGDVS